MELESYTSITGLGQAKLAPFSLNDKKTYLNWHERKELFDEFIVVFFINLKSSCSLGTGTAYTILHNRCNTQVYNGTIILHKLR